MAPTQSNPLYQPRPFADVVLTDSHPRRFEMDRRAKDVFHVVEAGVAHGRKRDYESNNNNHQQSENSGTTSTNEVDEETMVGGSQRDRPSTPLFRRPANANKRSRR